MCDFINTVLRHFTCMVACKRVLLLCMFVLTCFFFYFLLVWLCKFHSIGPEIKSYTVPSLSFFIFKLDSSVCDISLFSTLVYYLTGSLNFASELAFKARVE